MIDIQIYTPKSETKADREAIANFLFTHLEEYGDDKPDILKAMDYSLSSEPGKGGFVLTASEEGKMLGAVIVNETGMRDYIPENILVYIAVHHEARGKGVGKKLMETAIETADGDIALHVEPENPAKRLYERLGFTNKYLEMRYVK
ncbi:MAG: GNAT superfamily N-acetyltransferase [Flammeovirgaceae bacterium]|jgi:ribosomal-protein-alanine N-acetyltransferase